MSLAAQLPIAAFLLVGASASIGAGLGLLRLPDLLTRMHAATKPQSVGLLLVLVAVGIRFPTGEVITTLVLIALLQLTTVPVAAHLVGRAAYRTGQVRSEDLYVDELAEALDAAAD
ncbi:monovalent cation/H(+) antiporter subunit G [Actinomadura parmotrematis]|uniref:Monovalent cation/H(+) antiporter subunit G n=1 Tax=Actinomadura parmotrematis TaxID=2864039 RepID=A0ABS7FKV6_9ACTN|nr:monovalent cation/H(+) antiporter subunit G [Actinomadura parmotrematis]MBW8480992.1 monovalent cation/H(+) antiporter subunit G [Actinomadura parmotrematis]